MTVSADDPTDNEALVALHYNLSVEQIRAGVGAFSDEDYAWGQREDLVAKVFKAMMEAHPVRDQRL